MFCSNRGQRGGCGGTFSIFLAEVLPRHTVRATLLWKLLSQLLTEAGIKAAAETLRLPFALETLYPHSHNLVLIGQPPLLQSLALSINEEIHSRVTYSLFLVSCLLVFIGGQVAEFFPA